MSHEVRCACGAACRVEEIAFGQPQTCPSCHASFKLVWAIDSKSKKKKLVRMPVGTPSRGSVRIPAGAFEVHCPCGQVLVARREQSGKQVKCPVCGLAMKIEKYRDPQTMETRMRLAPAQQATAVLPAKSLGKTTRRMKAPGGAQDLLCECGENLRVFEEHLDKRAQCPACGTIMKLEKIRDPQTTLTHVRARIVGKAPPPARPDPDAWSLDDFS